ncbi:type II toxin-antitoxin system RelE/ParE family toxin [Caulobacter sp. NIBR1757]|uniref:type II toxin-antitoxin system RelE/ParE family toxin n=1 Tax=Caulobacter sp. NIBR1757 TaxID=3016000 RepID=UPI0022EFE667|nr:type II toxin-antitoxin system RelE/ParE family toxin [Caulobacter sp. NIBR1757]
MTVNVRNSDQAEVDLADIHDYIAANSPNAARKVLRRIVDRINLLRDAPLSGVARPDIWDGARHAVVGPYLILYQLEGDEVLIVRVVDGRQDLQNL